MRRRGVLVSLFVTGAALALALVSARAGKPIDKQVLIRRDAFGVPHVLGENLEAVAFGLGYAQAEDHVGTLGRRVLEARGEAARVFGAEALDGDLAVQRVNNVEEARRALKATNRDFRAVLEAFAAGANRYVASHRQTVPAWIPRITGADLLAASRADAIEMAFAPSLLEQLQAKYPPGGGVPTSSRGDTRDGIPWCVGAPCVRLAIPKPAAEEAFLDTQHGSNALALSGSRTTTGHPILLGNPHLQWSSRYWEAHLKVRGVIDFYGSTLVGIPWLRAGFNDRLGYVQTNNAPDYQDVYVLSMDPTRPNRYLFDGKSLPLTRRDVTVEVRTADASLEKERRTFWSTSLGPVVLRTPDRVFALKSAGLDCWTHFEGFFRLSQVRSFDQYRRVLEAGLFYMSNFLYADADGNVFYQWNTRLPRRADEKADYSLDVPGERRLVWSSLHAVGDLPRLLNPPGGYVQNANNSPWFVSRRDPIDPARFPNYVERKDLGLRPQIALQMLDARDRFSVDDVIALKFDDRMLLADRVKPALLDALRSQLDTTDDLRRACAVLSTWDGRVEATSRGAVLFARFWNTYSREVKQPFETPWRNDRPFETPVGLSDRAAAIRHLADAVKWTRKTFGAEGVAWGDVHRFRLGNIDLPGDGASGMLGLYRVMQFDEAPDGRRVAGQLPNAPELAGSGDAWVLAVHFGQPVEARSVLAYGQSADPASPHGPDQIRMFAVHQLRPVWFTDEQIAAHLEREYRPR